MSLRLYNTLTRKLETIDWPKDRVVGLYTCGPTVYSTAHLGNLRTYLFEDILKRTLELNGYAVKHVMNVTDVGHLTSDADTGEDKIEQAARQQHRSAWDIAKEHQAEFFRDLDRLHVQRPSTVLRATDTIERQIDLINKLEAGGHTYRTSDGIYFDTATDPGYGRLNKQKASDKKAGARVDVNVEKKHPSDFALWKFSKPADRRQMEWASPWGTGFPGWHIECSAMSISEFPQGLDIHCGGIDHIAVHHENEIAQNEGAGYENFVKLWMHGEFLILPGKRMGKSEGNTVTLQNVIDRGINPLAFRFLTLQAHYRQPLNFTWKALEAAAEGYRNLVNRVSDLGPDAKIGCAELEQRFTAAVSDDLNTAQALAVVQDVLKSDYPNRAKRQSLNVMDRVLGLGLSDLTSEPITVTPELQTMLDEREKARRAKDFGRSDELRRKILNLGYSVEDTARGPRLRKV